ncbi:DUF2489 domain-containing protein [Gilvimarinus sp. SDUM040013]|uniref:DUF2489 domain-containing protein n=1 Tax=Gilvimarinus gilvus TaxID=3058038 RepID=A0ABU4S2Z9_9GAMM|nr:DUF2489 domain-containing protein [Gilvimarinus sp. SDUM040013]MDO3384982.1 DUF2489 domain-containing protein [Gilvimarinus sp. SDUM040013]MDX6851503.1 DUF2489 domain-containing protein [Gilvimarinus sp. SDUM040013]
MNEFPGWLLLLALFVVATLAFIAGYYLYKVYKMRAQQKVALQELELKGLEQRARVNNSIQILAKAVGSEDLTITEASIRISVLLDGLSVSEEVKGEFSAFYQLRQATSHMPILEAWKALEKKDKKRLTKEREALEAQHVEFVHDAARRIIGRTF